MARKRDRREYNRQWYLDHKETENAGSKKYYADNTEKCKQLSRDWRHSNPESVKAQKKRHTKKYLEKSLAKIIAWKTENPERAREADREYCRRVKKEFVDAYGGGCTCCGETILEFLTCEHINMDGKRDRQQGFLGIKMYLKAKREGYPKDRYTVLCNNCNHAKRFGKLCPHEVERRRLNVVRAQEIARDLRGNLDYKEINKLRDTAC